MVKKIEVLLIEPLAGRGNAGDFITVAPSFAMNVLIPQGIAKVADKQVHNQRDTHMAKIAKAKAERQSKVTAVFSQLASSGIRFEKQATQDNGLYDTIDAKTLSVYLTQQCHITINPKSITMEKIEALWEYKATLTFEDLTQEVTIVVTRA
jgi:ribosomal protein L9